MEPAVEKCSRVTDVPWRCVRKAGRPCLRAGLWQCWTPEENRGLCEETMAVRTNTPEVVNLGEGEDRTGDPIPPRVNR